MIGVGNNGQFEILCLGLGRGDLLSDPKYLDNSARVENRVELLAILQSELQKFETQHWLKIFEGKQMPYAAFKFTPLGEY